MGGASLLGLSGVCDKAKSRKKRKNSELLVQFVSGKSYFQTKGLFWSEAHV